VRKSTGDLTASVSFLLASRMHIQLGLQGLASAASLPANFLSPPSGGQRNACRDLLPSHDGKNALHIFLYRIIISHPLCSLYEIMQGFSGSTTLTLRNVDKKQEKHAVVKIPL